MKGLGLEDLEGCERYFSKSNALANSVRHASTFHRQQSIVQYMRHTDNFETFANLSECNLNAIYLPLTPMKQVFSLSTITIKHSSFSILKIHYELQ